MYHISFGQEEFGEIRTILAGDAGDQSDAFTHFENCFRYMTFGYQFTF